MIIDSQPIFGAAVRSIFERLPSFNVLSCAHTLSDALAAACLAAVDVIIVDADLTDAAAENVIGVLHQRAPNAKLVSMVAKPDHGVIVEHLRSGASGVLSKNIDHALLVRRINDCVDGMPAFDRTTGTAFLAGVRSTADVTAGVPHRRGSVLSGRELEILSMYDGGSSTAAIGQSLHLSPATVKTHVSRAMAKLGASTRGEALAMCRQQGLL